MPSSFKNQTITTTRRNKMKKALLALLSIAIAFTALAPAQAEDQKVLAIIDSAINSNNFSSIIHEVCFTTVKSSVPAQNMSCPNGELFMEGKGAASAPWPLQIDSKTKLPVPGLFSLNNATFHGDTMVKAALTVNPNLKIVFIRFNDVTSLGNSRGDADALASAINWVSQNASKYSIDALSISQGSVAAGNLSRCLTDTTTINAISSLNLNNVPVFVAVGNDRRKDVVAFPSCVNGAIGVGALGNATQLEGLTNTGPGLDMVAPGKVRVTKYNGSPTDTAGSSVATAVSAASYVNRNTFKTFGEYLASLPKILIGTASYIRN
jgi:hypothetical protein